MAFRRRRDRGPDTDPPPATAPTTGYRVAAVSGVDVGGISHGVAIFGPGISAPLLGEPGVATCLVPTHLQASVAELCAAEVSGEQGGPEATNSVLDWLVANPSAGDANAFAMLTEVCARAGRRVAAADRLIMSIGNALDRKISNASCELQLKIELARSLGDTGDFTSAVRLYEGLAELFRGGGFIDGLRDMLPHFAWVLARAGMTARARDVLDEWEPLVRTNGEASLMLHYRATTLRFIHERGERIAMLRQSLRLLGDSPNAGEAGCIRVDLADAIGETRVPSDAAAAARELRDAIALLDSAGDVLHGTRARAGLVKTRIDAGELRHADEIDAAFEELRALRLASGDRDGHLADRWNRFCALDEIGALSDNRTALDELELICADARATRSVSLWAAAMQQRARLESLEGSRADGPPASTDPYHDVIAELYEVRLRLTQRHRSGV